MMSAPVSLQGCTAMIFGGSSGIGRAVALNMADQGAAQIWMLDQDPDKLEDAKNEIQANTDTPIMITTKCLDIMDERAVTTFCDGLEDNSIDHLVTTPGESANNE